MLLQTVIITSITICIRFLIAGTSVPIATGDALNI
jgi:hypothetical protein